MSLDYSEIIQGPPGKVAQDLRRRLAELRAGWPALKTGVTSDPERMLDTLRQGGFSPAMKLLWVSYSAAQAREMGELLRAWDESLFALDPALNWEAEAALGLSYYVFAALG
ncbi:hypothetical protein AAU61_02645 [Desulfocarbo indianensis]|nr:hypothetical protein AAU61_02645 [Desulfocarbo indianensis]